ncbi:MAG: HAD family hydrolase [Candidatus Anstonellales archaeon]
MKLVCFDLDETLCNLHLPKNRVTEEAKRIIGKKDNRIRELWNIYELYPKEAEAKKMELDSMLRRYERRCIEKEVVEPIKEGMEMLKMCKGKAKVAIVSNNNLATIKEVAGQLGIRAEYFIGRDCVKKPKPEPDMVIEAMNALGAERKDTVLVGDSVFDSITAVNAGIACIVVVGWEGAKKTLEAML